MICPPCAEAADCEADENRDAILDEFGPIGHPPEMCRDHRRAGCSCQHRPVRGYWKDHK